MDGCYAEYCVHRRMTSNGIIARCVMISLIVISVLFTLVCFLQGAMLVAILGFALTFVITFICVLFYPRFSVDWEYVFVDGQLDFDQILGGNARRRKLRIDFDQVEVIAKTGSHHLDTYSRMTMKELDYSSLDEDAQTYTVIAHKGTELQKIIFEPDENMINVMRSKSSRKVKKD